MMVDVPCKSHKYWTSRAIVVFRLMHELCYILADCFEVAFLAHLVGLGFA